MLQGLVEDVEQTQYLFPHNRSRVLSMLRSRYSILCTALLFNPMTVRVYIVRHGETEANATGIMQGHMDTKLNGVGRGQAERAAEALKNINFGIAFSSDLSRAADVSTVDTN